MHTRTLKTQQELLFFLPAGSRNDAMIYRRSHLVQLHGHRQTRLVTCYIAAFCDVWLWEILHSGRRIVTVLLSTRGQHHNRSHRIWLSVNYLHITFSSTASLLHRKPHRSLWSSLVHRCRHFSTTTGLHWTSWARCVL